MSRLLIVISAMSLGITGCQNAKFSGKKSAPSTVQAAPAPRQPMPQPLLTDESGGQLRQPNQPMQHPPPIFVGPPQRPPPQAPPPIYQPPPNNYPSQPPPPRQPPPQEPPPPFTQQPPPQQRPPIDERPPIYEPPRPLHPPPPVTQQPPPPVPRQQPPVNPPPPVGPPPPLTGAPPPPVTRQPPLGPVGPTAPVNPPSPLIPTPITTAPQPPTNWAAQPPVEPDGPGRVPPPSAAQPPRKVEAPPPILLEDPQPLPKDPRPCANPNDPKGCGTQVVEPEPPPPQEDCRIVANCNPPDPTKGKCTADLGVDKKRNKLDILFMVDTSASLRRGGLRSTEDGELVQIARGMKEFVKHLKPDTDYRVAVMTGHGPASPYHGKLISSGRGDAAVLDYKSLARDGMSRAQIERELGRILEAKMKAVPNETGGAQGEAMLLALYNSIINPELRGAIERQGLFRADASLNVIIVSDEQDVCFDYAGSSYKPTLVPAW